MPIPIEQIVDHILDIPIVWEPIHSPNGRIIVSKLTQPMFGITARIILNEDLLMTKFCECPGLERTALAHEAGHGVFHLERGRIQQLELGLDAQNDHGAFSSKIETLTNRLEQALVVRGPEGDEWWREWQAHTFMRFVLMPRRLLIPLLQEGGFRNWRGPSGLYGLRDTCDVTISALVVHLSKLEYIRVDREGIVHDVTPAAKGQRTIGA